MAWGVKMTFVETRKMIRISPDCHERLGKMKSRGDTFEDVIVWLMNLADGCEACREDRDYDNLGEDR